MTPAMILALIDLAISAIQKLAPVIKELAEKGDITVEQQQERADKIKALQADDLFAGPEWKAGD